MTLAQYMKSERLDDAAMGKLIKRSRVSTSRYRRGLEPIPSVVVRRLVKLSAGRMTANELLGIKAGVAA